MSPTTLSEPLVETLKRVALTKAWQDKYAEARARTDVGFCQASLEALDIRWRISEADLARLPKSGPVVFTANHPCGLLEGMVLGAAMQSIRPDFRFLANSLLAQLPELQPLTIFVDPYGGPEATRRNLPAMRSARNWLKQGHALVTFPAGDVATLDWRQGGVAEAAWNAGLAKLVQNSGAVAVPVYFPGANSPLFHLAGLVHPRLRTLLLPHELLNKQHREVEIRFGTPISREYIDRFAEPAELASYLRRRTLLLANRGEVPAKKPRLAPVAPETPATELERELAGLAPERRLMTASDYQVWLAPADEIPTVLREIGRLREVTFRASGEGTGNATDLDAFDGSYLHLFLWHPESRQLAGAYRLGATDRILPRHGKRGLYTNTLFRFENSFFPRLGPALELGRSFVRLEHQRSYAALLSLWKGIGRYVADHPRYRYLFGPVSISNRYLPISRKLLVEFLKQHRRNPDLASLVKPRSPFGWGIDLRSQDFASLVTGDAEEVSALLADIEVDRKGVPVLLRQYLKLGGELLGFNLDRKFSNVIDGLILVDLSRTEPRTLDRYMGKDGAARFRSHHDRGAVA